MTGPTVHSRIGASSMHRWKECPGSVRLSEGLPNTQSEFAALGTYAHEIAAEILLGNDEKAYKLLYDKYPEESQIEERNDMMGAVKEYEAEVKKILAKSPNTKMLVEHKFDLSDIHPNLFGTSDCIIHNPDEDHLYVIDYKHGAGLAVEADDNDQLKYYGLGAILRAGFKAKTVTLMIVQPRCYHVKGPVREFTFPSIDILDFAAELKAFAMKTEETNAPLKAGEHCRFCPAQAICSEQNKTAKALMTTHFTPVQKYDPEHLARSLEMLDTVESWAKSVREFAYQEALQGRVPPGYKLVQKQFRRRWRSEDDMATEARSSKREDFFETSLKSVAQVEKIVGKKEFEKLYGTHVLSESSGTTLVHVSDKREAVTGTSVTKFIEPVKTETTKTPSIFD